MLVVLLILESEDYLNDSEHSNEAAARINIYSDDENEYLISPVFDLSGSTYYLSFDLGMTDYGDTYAGTLADTDDYMALLVNAYDGNGWQELKRWDKDTPPSHLGQFEAFSLEGYNGDTVQFAFYGSSVVDEGPDNDWFIDNFSISSDAPCGYPEVVQAAVNGANTATVTWTAVEYEYEYEYGQTGFTLDSDTSGNIATNSSIELTGLVEGTQYDIYVRSKCGDGNFTVWRKTTWRQPFVPNYLEDFSTYLPEGWTEARGALPYPDAGGFSSFKSKPYLNDSNHENGAAARLHLNDDENEYLISPVFDLSGSTYYLSFDLGMTNYRSPNVGTLADTDDYMVLLVNAYDGNGWQELKRWDKDTPPSHLGQFEEFSLEGYNGDTVQFAFYGFSQIDEYPDNDWFIDNFSILPYSIMRNTKYEQEIWFYITENKLHIKGLTNHEISKVTLVNSLGVTVISTTIIQDGNPSFALPPVASGVYFVLLELDGKEIVKSIFVN